MTDDIAAIHGDKNDDDDDGCAASVLLPPFLADFEILCKPEPCSSLDQHDSLDNTNEEDLLSFDESSTCRIPISIPTIKDPIVLLERCDKIWKTLQLIKIVQTEKPVNANNEESKEEEIEEEKEEEEEEEVQYSDKVKQSVSDNANQSVLRRRNTVPFKFSVQKTRKLYPCTICGKQYLERRSLRKHSDRVHGITIPLLTKRKRVKNIAHLSNKNVFDKVNSVTLLNKKNSNLKNLNNDENLCKTKRADNTVVSRSNVLRKFVKCTLCQQRVTSIRKHLIHYHKIGGSSNVVEQLESSLLNENGSSNNKETVLENTSSEKSSQSVKMDTQDGFRIMDNEADTHKTSGVKRKRKYTLSYVNAKKRFKLNNEGYIRTRHGPTSTQKQTFLNRTNQQSYQCDICLGMYASSRSLYKHKRNHIFRGETKENIHIVKCRYHNSPFNNKYRTFQSSVMSTRATVRNTNINMINARLNNSKHKALFDQNDKLSTIKQTVKYNEKKAKNNQICLCGRSFRNPHTLFIHKKSCDLYKQDDTMSPHTSVSSDSGIGINITIKKLNNSYEIVGKDNNEDTSVKSEIYFQENNSCTSNISNNLTKDSVNSCTKESELSNYSKNHSILKLHIADEDVIIDVEDDIQIEFDKNDTSEQMVTQEDNKRYMSKEQNDVKNVKNEQVSDRVCTLKQMCQDVLDGFAHKSENAIQNGNEESSWIKDQEIHQGDDRIKSWRKHQENKRKLRSSNKGYQSDEKKLDNSNDGTMKVCTTKFDPLSVCGYCNEQFRTITSYYNHQCTVKQGKPFDEFSLELLCFYCKDVLNDFKEYDKHMRAKHFVNRYHCHLCIERFKNDKARLQHINLEHNNMSCRFCNEKISIKVKALHESYHLGFGFPCHKCKKAYTNGKNLSYHNYKSRLHPKTDHLVTCTICLKNITIRRFRTHMSTHKHNTCYFCGKVFSNRSGIEFHTMMHHGTQYKLKCNICDTRFFTKKQLEKHAKVDGCNSDAQGMRSRNTAAHHQ